MLPEDVEKGVRLSGASGLLQVLHYFLNIADSSSANHMKSLVPSQKLFRIS